MFMMLVMQAAADEPATRTVWQYIVDFVDSPAPYSPFSEYLLLLFILWLIARRDHRKKTFDAQAQEVLDAKYDRGELTKESYEKYRQDVSLRPKR